MKRRSSVKEREFHLCREPWICVMQKDFHVKKVNLEEALLQSEKYRGLAGETESQNIAILRLLLAVLHIVFCRQNEKGEQESIDSKKEARRRWEAIWKMGTFPEQPIKDYFSKWENRFWLFDSEYPFYQVPGITGTNNPAKKMNGELVESNNKIQLFSMRSGRKKDELNYDEAARWLVYLQAFDDTAAKKPSPKLCLVGSIGVVVAKGNSLFETLMLNLTLLKDGMELWGAPKPSWEREKPSEEKLKEVPVPDNQPEILTLQCRRLILHRENGIVTGYTEAAGEYIEKESAYSEQMTFWTIRKKGKNVEQYYPKMHDKSRQMWRDFSVLLGNSGRKPGVVSWVSLLQSKGIFPKDRFVTFKIVGVEYGSMTCGIVDEFSDSLEFHASLLDEVGVVWQRKISDEIARCDQLASAVGCLGQNLDKAVGGDGKSAKENAKEQAYYRLDISFRQWLLQVEPNQNLEKQNEYRANWRKISKDIIKNFGRELVEQAGSAAVVGRVVKEKIKNKDVEKHYSAPEAFNYFLYQLAMIDKQGVRI